MSGNPNQWLCLDCHTTMELDQHGRCGKCGSAGVMTALGNSSELHPRLHLSATLSKDLPTVMVRVQCRLVGGWAGDEGCAVGGMTLTKDGWTALKKGIESGLGRYTVIVSEQEYQPKPQESMTGRPIGSATIAKLLGEANGGNMAAGPSRRNPHALYRAMQKKGGKG